MEGEKWKDFEDKSMELYYFFCFWFKKQCIKEEERIVDFLGVLELISPCSSFLGYGQHILNAVKYKLPVSEKETKVVMSQNHFFG